ncbi:glycosyl transferase [Aphanothece hegewaldii CCALA 016]|uniref:Glycosyl transferase n=1 Tax=Aphanothece hegewaldii CCALA 016 TaxID=2107694 RepID=A0A2T1M0V3_9CHRO|nr:glycosyltransferase family 2 protein [Aphanothece hegewaldii]PSF38306.1 glycosyl transferase [Aphanothece hegewaldii CCALA 016]
MDLVNQSLYILIVNYNSSGLVSRLVDSILANENLPKQIIIVNNSPEDRELEKLASQKIIILQSTLNLGFGKACNLGLNMIYHNEPNSIVWLLNPDTYLPLNSIKKAEEFLIQYPEISILGTEVYEPDGNLWFGWGSFTKKDGTIISEKESLVYNNNSYLKVDWVTGCSLIINLKKFTEMPYFDPDYFLYYEDVDFCDRYANQGHLVVITNQIKVIHEPSSITLRYGYLQLIHNIYSYLLILEKQTNSLILLTRLIRMIITSIIILPFNPKFSLSKLQGIWMYLKKNQYVKNIN